MPTEPNFVTKPRPPVWEKPSTSQRPHKPTKPSKKPPSHTERPMPQTAMTAANTQTTTYKPHTASNTPSFHTVKPTKPEVVVNN